CQHSWEIPPTF
nr:immunoglobulin light chain junction region [Mus musculus]NSL97030.1 immunoglobulin light chain junction region [Mus musculus]NSL97081.1 immunoglobulin light chain junction region [Mus musculus]NSL97119.1 immunoglobulin light chain junction region [Mus musculus]NSL97160.1 immunoglobulin light chain junction region [Mus musculus]